MNNHWTNKSLNKRKTEGYWVKYRNYAFPVGPEFLWMKRRFKVGDKVVCIEKDESPRGKLLESDKIYIISRISFCHNYPFVHVDGIDWRYKEERFEFA